MEEKRNIEKKREEYKIVKKKKKIEIELRRIKECD